LPFFSEREERDGNLLLEFGVMRIRVCLASKEFIS